MNDLNVNVNDGIGAGDALNPANEVKVCFTLKPKKGVMTEADLTAIDTSLRDIIKKQGWTIQS